jgi:uncharacterized protein YegP (UPF0339 family)
MSDASFIRFQDTDGDYRIRVKAKNGEIVYTSEGYTRPEDAIRGFHDLIDVIASVELPVRIIDQDES